MLPDNGLLTIKKALGEYRGEIAQARRQDKNWPFTPAHKKACRRRPQFVELILAKAKAQDLTIEEAMEALSAKYKNQTVNSIREELLANAKGKGKEHQ